MQTKIDCINKSSSYYEKQFKVKCIKVEDIGNCYELTFKGTKTNINKMLKFHHGSIK
jgi:hypothetical protein